MYYNGCKTNPNLNDVFETIGKSIINFDAIKGFDYLNDSFSNAIKEVGKTFTNVKTTLSAKLDILEDDNNYEVIVELAGVNKEDVKILAKEENTIKIIASKKKPDFGSESNKKFVLQERNFGETERTLNFPKPINKESISAKWLNGELLITIPKVLPPEDKEIQIIVE